jgi:hypothetical protein
MGEGMKEDQQTLEHKIGRTEGGKRGTLNNWYWQICISILIQGKFMGICPPPIDERATLIHVGGNANGIRPYPKDAGMVSICSNLRGLQAGSVSIGETNVEWQKYEWRENTYQTLRKTFGDARVEFSTSKAKFEGRYKLGSTATAALGAWTHRVVHAGCDATGCGRWSYITYGGKGGKRLTYIAVYRVCDQTDPGDTTAPKQQYNMQYED